ncbi:hypothetical protein MPDQ_003027 [Monascus purpureus]|uniref:Major facilitator superfamily (MFS) profile domain-containing protein n=1 Tax=Monascus purpureus TaxID=5098 RepID=A0A507R417_MONPU|nr:hypothetical protein MPDQ_003027 [Monascus purpureus]
MLRLTGPFKIHAVVLTAVLPYLPEMIEYLGVPKNEVAKWVGIISAVTSGCQASMAVVWGTISDTAGRKPIILLGLSFTMIFSLIFGFSQSLGMLIVARAMQGFMNGNVGILRTMVAELVPERELQPRAFSVMPLVWTVGSIFGPAFGGALARPAEKHPELFGRYEFFKKYPFALPNLAAAALFVVTSFAYIVQETLESKKGHRDYGLVLGEILTSPCTSRRRKRKSRFHSSKTENDETAALLGNRESQPQQSRKEAPTERPSWSQVFSPQSNLVLLAYTMLATHTMAFDSQFPVLMHYPVQEIHSNPDVKLPFKFAGGFGVDAQTIGIFYTLIGTMGMFIQFLFFPWAAKRYGVLPCLRTVSILFPIIYAIVPFTVLVPHALRNITISFLILSRLAAGIFCFPCCIILLTNSATSRSVLGTLNGVATSISAVGRAVGPAVLGTTFSFGIKIGFLVVPWWTLTGIAVLSALPVFWIVEGDGLGDEDNEGNEDDDDDDDDDDDESQYDGCRKHFVGTYGATGATSESSGSRST